MIEIGVALFVLFLLVVITFLLLKRIVNRVNEQSKLYFTLKLQEYDELVAEREKRLEEIKREEIQPQDKEEEKEIKAPPIVVYKKENPEYQMEDLLKTVKKVEDRFQLDMEETIKKFLNQVPTPEELERFHKLEQMKEYILERGVYNIIVTEEDDTLEQIFKELRMIDVDIVDAFVFNNSEVTIEEFLNYIENEQYKCDPYIYVEVGDKKLNFDYLSKRIKTQYNEKIYRGIMIVYRNKMYDYSLN